MRITGFAVMLLGTVIHNHIAIKAGCTHGQYWALYGAMVVVMIGSYIMGVNAGKRIEE